MMDIHPWTKYEVARIRDEERLKAARAAMRSLEARESRSSGTETDSEQAESSWLDRIRRRGSASPGAPAQSGTS